MLTFCMTTLSQVHFVDFDAMSTALNAPAGGWNVDWHYTCHYKGV